jgi:ferritin-like metal-binding protein YciE
MRALLEEQMIGRLHDIHAMEAGLRRLLDKMVEKTDDPRLRSLLKRHVQETRHHDQRVIERLQAHGESARPSAAAAASGGAEVERSPTITTDDDWHAAARDGLDAARVKISFYEQLEHTATRVGDERTAQVARWNREEERDLAQTIASRVRGPEARRVAPAQDNDPSGG